MVEKYSETLNGVTFAESNMELEEKRLCLLQAIRGLALLRNSPMLFARAYTKFSKEFTKFEKLIHKNMFSLE